MRVPLSLLLSLPLLLAAGLITDGAPMPSASAQNAPWCARYGGADSPGVAMCTFTSQAQCLASIRGLGGFCEPNWPQSGGPQRRR